MLSGAQLCAAALVKLGEKPIDGFEEGGPVADICKVLYPPIRDALYSVQPWSFLTERSRPNRLPDKTPEGYLYAYRLPNGLLRVVSMGNGNVDVRASYKIAAAGEVWTDAEDPVLTWIGRRDETLLPPFFDIALIDRLAADLCVPITEDAIRAATLNKVAEQSLARARLADSQQNTNNALQDFTLIEVRG